MPTSRVPMQTWVDLQWDYLYQIYTHIQECNHRSGRHAFDSDKCDFSTFCRIAYLNSTIFEKQASWMYAA
jgi:hypothetical protein